jgi:2-dehydropantoate 2-reductase
VVARSDHDVVARDGFRIDSLLGDLSFRPHRVLREPSGAHDYLLVATKLVRGLDRVALIRPGLGARTAVVLVQNGIGIEDEVAQAYPDHELISAIAYAAVSREAPGQVRHQSEFTRLVMGRYPRGASSAAQRLAELVQRGGSSAQVTEDIVGERWRKCAWNTVFNPISALGGGLGTRDILSSETSVAFVREAIAEVCAVAAAAGHALAADTVDKTIAGTLRMPNYVSSMGQDVLAGRALETEALLGNAVRVARRHGVPVPRLESLYHLLQMLEQKLAAQA